MFTMLVGVFFLTTANPFTELIFYPCHANENDGDGVDLEFRESKM